MKSKKMLDIAIIGGGHAGCEAAWISSQMGLDIGLFSIPGVGLASAPCNPAIGGVGKGQVVRELDALGGLMGILADRAAIQCRILNESKGYAVQSTRFQIDKYIYSQLAEELISSVSNIHVFRIKIESIKTSHEGFAILDSAGGEYFARKVIVTTGTFLNGKMHTGEVQTSGGRAGCDSAQSLENIFVGVETLGKRFKTGTPPRLSGASIDFSKLVPQESDDRCRNFHCLHQEQGRFLEQISCYLTRTNENTLNIIRANKELSPIFNGQIKGTGPRYCPSIEDKAFRYLDRDSHHIFIEPEDLSQKTFYPNGISTSLPSGVQAEFIHTIEGLECAEIVVNGYAVEYDVVNTGKLDRTLQYATLPGLYFAGQVNGTSGYEEAAGQGLIAGINAALSLLGRPALIINRHDSYIGVMIEDLVSNHRDEPYRLFTARSENRLYIREDNTILRMAPYRAQLSLKTSLDEYQDDFLFQHKLLWEIARATTYIAHVENQERFRELGYGELSANVSLAELVKRGHLDPVATMARELELMEACFRYEVVYAVAVGLKYEGYVNRANEELEKLNRHLSKNIDWRELAACKNISNECRQRIEGLRPETFGQLKRIDGIRPATLAFVVASYL